MRTRRLLFALAGAALLSGAAPLHAVAALRTVGAVVQTAPTADGVDLRLSSGAFVHVGFAMPDVVRVRMDPRGSFAPDVSYAIAGAPPRSAASVESNDGSTELRSATGTRVVIRKTPELAISVYDRDGQRVVADDPARPMAFNPRDGAIETSMHREDFELYYGFGEKTLPLSRHQQSMVMWNSDVADYPAGHDPSYQAIPFFIALHDGKS